MYTKKTLPPAEYSELKKNKFLKKAPCGRLVKNETSGKMEMFFPPVDCELKCDTCGWNPVVAVRRKEKLREELAKRRRKKR